MQGAHEVDQTSITTTFPRCLATSASTSFHVPAVSSTDAEAAASSTAAVDAEAVAVVGPGLTGGVWDPTVQSKTPANIFSSRLIGSTPGVVMDLEGLSSMLQKIGELTSEQSSRQRPW
jgi:hypothetical protein